MKKSSTRSPKNNISVSGTKVEAWLKDGIAHIEGSSQMRTNQFYSCLGQSMQLFNGSLRSRADNHEQTEKILKLQGLQYMLQHLIGQGLGTVMPSLDSHLANVKGILGGNAGPEHGDTQGVLNFIGVSPIQAMPFMPRHGSSSGAAMASNENDFIHGSRVSSPVCCGSSNVGDEVAGTSTVPCDRSVGSSQRPGDGSGLCPGGMDVAERQADEANGSINFMAFCGPVTTEAATPLTGVGAMEVEEKSGRAP